MDQPELPGMPVPQHVREDGSSVTRRSITVRLYEPISEDPAWLVIATDQAPGRTTVVSEEWDGVRAPYEPLAWISDTLEAWALETDPF